MTHVVQRTMRSIVIIIHSPALGVAPAGKALVFDHPARETGEDRSHGSEALAVCGFSNGGSGGTEGVVKGNSGADQTVVAATAAGENGMTAQNLGISQWREQGRRSGNVPGHQQ